MSILDAGSIIRNARTAANLTQKQLAEGICKVTTLSQIENGSLNASTAVFEALMSRLGTSYTTYPCFCSRTDFDCFYTLKRARFYVESWQLKEAVHELDFVESHHWADNRFHYAEWVLLHAKVQFLSGCCNHQKNYDFLLHGLSITIPSIDFADFKSHLFSTSELEYLILLAEESLHLGKDEDCLAICQNIQAYLENAHITFLDKDRLLAETAVVLVKYYIVKKQYNTALSIIEPHRYLMVLNKTDLPLLRLTFLKGMALYLGGQKDEGLTSMKVVLYSAHAINSCYATICANFLSMYTDINVKEFFPLQEIPLVSFTEKEAVSPTGLTDGTYDVFDKDSLTIGQIIGKLREEQGLTQEILFQGLCNKTTYSRIERNETQPDIYLTEALLQRLGYSERPFIFYSNQDNRAFFDLKFKSMNVQRLGKETISNYFEQLEKLSAPKNLLQKQYLLGRKAELCDSPAEQIAMYFESLHCTLPGFDISRIHNYRLSWVEWTVLYNIAHIYRQTDSPTESFYYFKQLISYANSTKLDVIFQKNTYMPMLEMYLHSLYSQKHYADVLHFFSSSHLASFKCYTYLYAFFLFYYSQNMGECKYYDQARTYGNYARALNLLNQLEQNADILGKYLFDDFSIELETF